MAHIPISMLAEHIGKTCVTSHALQEDHASLHVRLPIEFSRRELFSFTKVSEGSRAIFLDLGTGQGARIETIERKYGRYYDRIKSGKIIQPVKGSFDTEKYLVEFMPALDVDGVTNKHILSLLIALADDGLWLADYRPAFKNVGLAKDGTPFALDHEVVLTIDNAAEKERLITLAEKCLGVCRTEAQHYTWAGKQKALYPDAVISQKDRAGFPAVPTEGELSNEIATRFFSRGAVAGMRQ